MQTRNEKSPAKDPWPDSVIRADIEKRFTYRAPHGDQAARYATIREQAKALALYIQQISQPSRELSLALTKLEEFVMWANAGIARNELPVDAKPTSA